MKSLHKSIMEEVSALLRSHTNPTQAIAMSSYMRNQFQFYGIKSPLRKAIVKEIKGFLKPHESLEYQEFILLLWEEPYRECQYIANDLLGTIAKKLDIQWIELLEQLILTKSWWDTVDFLAPNLIGNIFIKNPSIGHQYTDRWITHDNIWLQRSALIYQLRYKDIVDFDRLTRYILRRKDSKEFFVQKASGWALRQYSKYEPHKVADFLFKNKDLASLTVKEGSKYL